MEQARMGQFLLCTQPRFQSLQMAKLTGCLCTQLHPQQWNTPPVIFGLNSLRLRGSFSPCYRVCLK